MRARILSSRRFDLTVHVSDVCICFLWYRCPGLLRSPLEYVQPQSFSPFASLPQFVSAMPTKGLKHWPSVIQQESKEDIAVYPSRRASLQSGLRSLTQFARRSFSFRSRRSSAPPNTILSVNRSEEDLAQPGSLVSIAERHRDLSQQQHLKVTEQQTEDDPSEDPNLDLQFEQQDNPGSEPAKSGGRYFSSRKSISCPTSVVTTPTQDNRVPGAPFQKQEHVPTLNAAFPLSEDSEELIPSDEEPGWQTAPTRSNRPKRSGPQRGRKIILAEESVDLLPSDEDQASDLQMASTPSNTPKKETLARKRSKSLMERGKRLQQASLRRRNKTIMEQPPSAPQAYSNPAAEDPDPWLSLGEELCEPKPKVKRKLSKRLSGTVGKQAGKCKAVLQAIGEKQTSNEPPTPVPETRPATRSVKSMHDLKSKVLTESPWEDENSPKTDKNESTPGKGDDSDHHKSQSSASGGSCGGDAETEHEHKARATSDTAARIVVRTTSEINMSRRANPLWRTLSVPAPPPSERPRFDRFLSNSLNQRIMTRILLRQPRAQSVSKSISEPACDVPGLALDNSDRKQLTNPPSAFKPSRIRKSFRKKDAMKQQCKELMSGCYSSEFQSTTQTSAPKTSLGRRTSVRNTGSQTPATPPSSLLPSNNPAAPVEAEPPTQSPDSPQTSDLQNDEGSMSPKLHRGMSSCMETTLFAFRNAASKPTRRASEGSASEGYEVCL